MNKNTGQFRLTCERLLDFLSQNSPYGGTNADLAAQMRLSVAYVKECLRHLRGCDAIIVNTHRMSTKAPRLLDVVFPLVKVPEPARGLPGRPGRIPGEFAKRAMAMLKFFHEQGAYTGTNKQLAETFGLSERQTASYLRVLVEGKRIHSEISFSRRLLGPGVLTCRTITCLANHTSGLGLVEKPGPAPLGTWSPVTNTNDSEVR